MAKISVVVPVYNVEKYLERCVNSLINQTLMDIEIILVDDGSPDNCPIMCDEFAKQDSRIKVVHKSNAGLGFARNSGIEVANGDFIAFVDSDDFVKIDMCEKLYEAAVTNDADVVYGGIYIFSNVDKSIIENPYVTEIKIFKSKTDLNCFLLDMIATNPQILRDTVVDVSVWKALFKKSIFDEFNIKFVSERKFISEDVIFDIDYLQHAKKIVVIPDMIYYYCVNPISLSKVYRDDRFKKNKVMYFEVKRKLNLLFDKNMCKNRTDRFLLARARVDICQIVANTNKLGLKNIVMIVKEIQNDDEIRTILKRYSISDVELFSRIFFYALKYKLTIFVILLSALNNFRKKLKGTIKIYNIKKGWNTIVKLFVCNNA